MSRYRKILFTFACLVFFFRSVVQVQAQGSVPSTITLTIYQLRDNGGASTGTVCTKGAMTYGCTAYSDELYKNNPNEFSPGVYGYPFEESTVTLDFETQYLLNVVPSEMIGTFHPRLSYEAQAIASRSYIGHKLANNVGINNSASLQTYIPNQ